MKGGATLYRRMIARETTLALDPEDVHRLGLGEVARIQREMEVNQIRKDKLSEVRDKIVFPLSEISRSPFCVPGLCRAWRV